MGAGQRAGISARRHGSISSTTALNAQTGAIRLRASFDNAKGQFTPGLATRLLLEDPTPYTATLVPERAIGTDQTKKYVYVVVDGGQAQQREVKLGTLKDGMRVVRGAVKPGENVVVDGLQRVIPGRAGAAAGAERSTTERACRSSRRRPARPARRPSRVEAGRERWTSPASSSTGRASRA